MTANFLLSTLVLLALNYSNLALAKSSEQEFSLTHSKIKIDIPENWQTVERLFGMPLMLLGPMKNGKRPVISIISTNIKDMKLDEKEINKNKLGYISGRKKWIASKNGAVIKFLPYKKEKWKSEIEAHWIGYQYDLNKHRFTEKTYYVLCNNQLFNFKTLVTTDHKEFSNIILKTLKSVRCVK